MPSTNPQNHNLMWTDLLKDLALSSASWWQVAAFLYNKEHGYSNYCKGLRRGHELVRAGVFEDSRVQQYVAADEANARKVEAILDEMCHLLNSQSNPSRRLKYAGLFFLKCITRVYSSIYVNNHLLPVENGLVAEQGLFKKQFLSISKELPLVILPTHRSYMDFLFISYIMTHYELPLPIVATGDNFKAMGKVLTNYLKSTGAFLLRRNAARKKDIEANVYHDILRAYVHSILVGGENPIEFFMEGTRTRVGQVLRPKTGLLSMVVDAMIDGVIDDVYILPVAINYQRPIEEQLYIAENTPQINGRKPKESAKNLISGFDAVMKRQYGKVYVRFLEPFKLSKYFSDWKQVTKTGPVENGARDGILFDFTNSLASKVCLAQANNNILMPFNLLTCSMLSRTFLDSKLHQASELIRVPLDELVTDFQSLEELLRSTQKQFLPGWESRLEILDEFKLDRDGIVRASEDRRYVEFRGDPLTFQTLLYYSNQTLQMLIPVAICSLLSGVTEDKWEQYKTIRTLLIREFFSNESFMEQEFDGALAALKSHKVSQNSKQIILRHLAYFIKCYLQFLRYLRRHSERLFDKSDFFQLPPATTAANGDCNKSGGETVGHADDAEEEELLYISKDMLKNMTSLVRDEAICEPTSPACLDDALKVVDVLKLNELIKQYETVLKVIGEQEVL